MTIFQLGVFQGAALLLKSWDPLKVFFAGGVSGVQRPQCKYGRFHALSRKLLQLESWNFTDVYIRSSAPFGNDNFFCKGRLWGAVPPSVNLEPLISRFFVRWLPCVKLFLCFHSCFPSPHLLWRSWVKVKRRSKLCEGQPLCHSALRRCLVGKSFPP